jgi:drug/metabolite transporter (DMT)-like permease
MGPAAPRTAGQACCGRRHRVTPGPKAAPLWQGLALAAAGSIAFSGKAIIVKLAYRHGVDAVTVIMLRMGFALPLFVALAWWAGRGKPALQARDYVVIAGLGFSGYYLASMLDFLGLQYISASLERLILYLNPTLVLGLGVLLGSQRARPRQWAALAVSYCGVLLVFGHEASLAGKDSALGALLVFASAVSYAVYLVYSGREVQRLGALRLTGWASTVACLLCLLQFALLRPLDSALQVPPPVLWLSVLNAVACTFAPVIMVMMALERVGPAVTAQTGMIGPLSTIAMGVLILGEPLSAWIGAGTLLVLAGIWLLARGR